MCAGVSMGACMHVCMCTILWKASTNAIQYLFSAMNPPTIIKITPGTKLYVSDLSS